MVTKAAERNHSRWVAVGAMLLATLNGTTALAEWSGNWDVEARLFAHPPVDPRQHEDNLSITFQPEYYRDWDDGAASFLFVPFLRIDQGDEERSHGDIREALYTRAEQAWELKAGVGKVFWGVTESQHLVDIINQSDLVENLDGEDKLGQPMLNLNWISEASGTLGVYMLPGFRERTFVGTEGRIRAILPVATELTQYESSQENEHIDWALRWTRTLSIWDLGLSYFNGTSRDPELIPALDAGLNPVLAPRYNQIEQWGLDLQATQGAWLWKLEAIRRASSDGEFYRAATGGMEYSFFGIADSALDLGVILEHLYDSRRELASSPFADDWFLGARLAFNDVQSTELLAGLIRDRRLGSRIYSLEASRRIGEHQRLSIELRVFSRIATQDLLLDGLRDDDLLQLTWAWFF